MDFEIDDYGDIMGGFDENGSEEDLTSRNGRGFTSNFRGRGISRGGGASVFNESGDSDRLTNKFIMEFTSSRGRGRLPPPAFTSQGKYGSTIPPSLETTVSSITKKLNHIEISSASYTPSNADDIRPTVKDVVQLGTAERRLPEVPPRMQETSATNIGRSKRYSAQRQRSLPETTYSPPPPATPPQTQQQPPQQHPIPYYPPPPPTQTINVPDYPPPPVFNEAVPPPTLVTFVPSGPPPPPGTAPPFPPPPIINYVQTPAAFHTIPLQPPPVQAVQQAELFQSQSGITYYSTQTQAALPRPTPPRRVKLAIPIVPPPDQPPRGRGRSNEQDAKA